MSDETLADLLDGNDSHVETLPAGYFDDVLDGQQPDVVSICCSDSRVSQEGMWGVERPGAVFTPSNIGNQVWDDHDGEKIVDGNLEYPLHHCGTDTVAVVGHTGCGAVTAAYRAASGAETPGPRGVGKFVDMLVPVIEEGLADDAVDADADGAPTGDADETTVINQLVEYNVDHQVEFLLESDAAEVPDAVSVYGFVYDFQGIYGDDLGRTYLVNADGSTAPDEIAGQVPDRHADSVDSLLY